MCVRAPLCEDYQPRHRSSSKGNLRTFRHNQRSQSTDNGSACHGTEALPPRHEEPEPDNHVLPPSQSLEPRLQFLSGKITEKSHIDPNAWVTKCCHVPLQESRYSGHCGGSSEELVRGFAQFSEHPDNESRPVRMARPPSAL